MADAPPPLVLPGYLSPAQVEWIRQRLTAGRPGVEMGKGGPIRWTVPEPLPGMTRVTLDLVGRHFNLPVHHVDPGVVVYGPGSEFPEHTDAWPGMQRTVSFSVLLSSPGEEFDGGDFLIDGKPVPVGLGGLVGFTADTLHSVATVASGQRTSWIGFGST